MQGSFCLFVAAQPCFFITGSAFPMFQVLRRLGLVVVSIVFSIEVIELRLSVPHVYGISFVLGSLFFFVPAIVVVVVAVYVPMVLCAEGFGPS